jgi:type II secretory pathway pseudopilin PulG
MRRFSAIITRRPRRRHCAFSLIELLSAMSVLVVLIALLAAAFNQTKIAWMNSENRMATYQQARSILDFMSTELMQAVAATNILFHGQPDAVFFVAPVGGDTNDVSELCEVGYVFAPGAAPDYLWQVSRRFTPPSTANLTGSPPLWNIHDPEWWDGAGGFASERILLSNSVLNLSFGYTVNGAFTTSHTGATLPEAVQITIQVVDERAARRLRLMSGDSAAFERLTNESARVFSTYVHLRMAAPQP